MTRKATPTQTLYEAKWTSAKRKQYLKDHPENFAGPDGTYPIEDASDVGDAWGLAGHAADPDAVRTKIISIAKRLGFAHALPDTAKAGAKENVQIAATSPRFTPRQRIATLTTCFLEDDAISLNGRQYPREAVDRLVQSAQIALADTNHPPLTCYISHGSADNDNTLELVGKLTQVWKEGAKAYASIDVPGTRAGEDVATLASGGYIKTQSLRASNARLFTDKHKAYPQVGGESLSLDGIDFTTAPGLPDVARINQVLLESADKDPTYEHIAEFFSIPQHSITLAEEGDPMTDTLKEGAQMPNAPRISGDSPALDGTASQGAYGQRMYQAPQLDPPGPMQGMQQSQGLMEAHGRIATVMGMPCAPSRESAQGRAIAESLALSPLTEAGKRLSAATRGHLGVAHDGVASALGLECKESGRASAAAANTMDGDGDNDGDQPVSKENAHMKNDEARRLLEAQGYSIAPPKSAEQILEEKLAEQARILEAKFEERLKTITAGTPAPAPQRKSLVSGANADTKASASKASPYMPGSYLTERLGDLSWRELADRTHPLPQDLSLELLLKEFEQLYAVQYDDKFGTSPFGA